MNEREFPTGRTFEPAEGEAETSEGFISIEDLIARLDQERADESSIFEMIFEAAGAIPVPNPEDVEASEEFERRLLLIENYAHQRFGRTVLLEELERWVEERRQQARKSD